MPKKILAALLALLMAATLCGCDLLDALLGSGVSGPDDVSDDPAVGDGSSYAAFIAVMRDVKTYGDRMAQAGLTAHSEYYYSFAGASVSALRYAVEYILWLKGEGDSLASFTAGSRYTGWETIAEINYASPYPSYFEGLLLEVQGKTDECIDPYAAAAIMPLFPEEGLDFYYLKKMDVPALYELRDTLRQLEDQIYGAYTPALTGHAWDRLAFDAGYLVGQSAAGIRAQEYASAFWYARQALPADPSDVTVWQNAAACALYAQEFERAGAYLDEGLTAFPEDEDLLRLKQMFIRAVEEEEAQR